MSTQTDIINLAIYKPGQSNVLPAITDDSLAADVFNRLWGPTLDEFLADGVWTWALKAQLLATSSQAPDPGWEHAYAYPNDCITAWAITDAHGLRGTRTLGSYCDPGWTRSMLNQITFEWMKRHGDLETEIQTDVPDAYLVYTVRVENTGRIPPKAVEALACLLAAKAAAPLSGDIGLRNEPGLLNKYAVKRNEAQVHDANEGREWAEPMTPSMLARG